MSELDTATDTTETVKAAAASRSRRLAATAFDFIIVPPVALFLMLVTGLMEDADAYVMPQPLFRLFGLLVVSYFLVNGYLLIKHSQTVGKKLMKIRITSNKTGEPLPPVKLFLRAFTLLFLMIIPFQYNILFLLVLIDPLLIFHKSNRCLHDLIASSTVQPCPDPQT